jgi:ammonium transporter Rh
VAIGATAGIIFHPAGSLAIGFLIGIVSTLGFQYLTPYLEKKIGLYDTCGVHNLHAIPGLCGGLVSAVVAASYYYSSATDAYPVTATEFPYLSALTAAPYKQGGLQVAATFTSIGIGIATALISGVFLRFVYSFGQKEFFTDEVYFEEAGEFIEELNIKHQPEVEYAKVHDKTMEVEANFNGTIDQLKPTV